MKWIFESTICSNWNSGINMKNFKWKVNYVVEGLLPLELPKTVNKEYVLERIIEKEPETRAILSVGVSRQPVPSEEEVEKVRRIAYERVERLVNFYSLFIGGLRILYEESVEQVTPYKGRKLLSRSFRIRGRVALTDEEWHKGIKLFQEVETQSLEKYLSLALSHYNLAFWTEPKSSFLNLMICIEALYNTDPQELRYRISHRVANLLGRTEILRRRIFKNIQDLYSKRNRLVHGLKPVEVTEEDRELLRTYSKHSLWALLNLGQKKKDILEKIDDAIYDEKIRKNIQEKLEDILDRLEKKLKEKQNDPDKKENEKK